MDLDAAVQLAVEINKTAGFQVIAIGRFVLVEELKRHSAHCPLPWGVSVCASCGLVGRVWNHKEWIQFRETALAPMSAAVDAKPKILPRERTDARHRLQPSLFD